MPVKKTETVKKTPAQLRKENEELKAENKKLKEGCYCHMCGKPLEKKHFYMSTDPLIQSGRTFICRTCAYKIARPKDEDGNWIEPTKASVMKALEYLDKPFLSHLWDSSYYEWKNGTKQTIWEAYIKNVSMVNYKTLRWKDGDVFKNNINLGKLDDALPSELEEKEYQREKSILDEALEQYENNKKSIVKIVGYDPFDDGSILEEDKPYLYNDLGNMIDEETKNDGMKMKAVIQIVQTHNQIRKINKYINGLVNDPSILASAQSLASLDKWWGIVNKMVTSSNALAKDNGISVNNNNNKSKGANTLSGKIKSLSQIGFRSAEINTFDYGTCEGMKQVAMLSEESRHKQIGYDENIAQEIKDIKVELVEKLTYERDAALESMRKMLVENLDLKEFLKSKGLIDDSGRVIDP